MQLGDRVVFFWRGIFFGNYLQTIEKNLFPKYFRTLFLWGEFWYAFKKGGHKTQLLRCGVFFLASQWKSARRGEFEKEKFTTVTGDFVRMKRMEAFAFDTPLKFNMEAENQSPEGAIPFGTHHFQVPC